MAKYLNKGCPQRDGVEREECMRERGASALGRTKKETVQTCWGRFWTGIT